MLDQPSIITHASSHVCIMVQCPRQVSSQLSTSSLHVCIHVALNLYQPHSSSLICLGVGFDGLGGI